MFTTLHSMVLSPPNGRQRKGKIYISSVMRQLSKIKEDNMPMKGMMHDAIDEFTKICALFFQVT